MKWRRPTNVGSPAGLRPWLTDEGSLTARLKSRCKVFHVQVLQEGMAVPYRGDGQQIGLRRSEYAWIREVLLFTDGRPVVFAYSIAAPRDLRGPWRMMSRIGTRPLGAALFADPAIVRLPLRIARVAVETSVHCRAETALNASLPTLWARRSQFMSERRPLLVTEVFLPGVECLD
jgi:chorismate--pyruvate lyase